jgi:hypothetical protein
MGERKKTASGKTARDVRLAIQNSAESLRAVADRYGVNVKTALRWRKRNDVEDKPTGPKDPVSTGLSKIDEAVVVSFREQTLLPLDDCLYALHAIVPRLSRAALYRCYRRYGISQLPRDAAWWAMAGSVDPFPLGYLRLEVNRIQSREGAFHLFFAIDLRLKLMYEEVHQEADRRESQHFLTELVRAYPYKIIRIATHDRPPFQTVPEEADLSFSELCAARQIEHVFLPSGYPWTNEQSDKMRRIYDLVADVSYYETLAQAQQRIQDFNHVFNFDKRMKALGGHTPYGMVCRLWDEHPNKFRANPRLHIVRVRDRPTCNSDQVAR